MNRRVLIRKFATAKETKEIIVAHAILLTIVGLTYLWAGMSATLAYVTGALFFIELVFFHVLWIYRDNTDRDHPLAFSIGVEIVNLVIGVIGAVVVFGVAIAADHYIGIPFYLPLFGVVLAFFAYSGWKVKYHLPEEEEDEST